VAWRQTGEFVSRYFTKGRMALVEGKLQTRDYTDRDGNRRYATEVVADNVYFGDSRRDGEGGGYAPAPTGGRGYGAPAGGYGAPGGNYPSSGGGYSAAPAVDQFADLTDDDGELPF
jgi:single-strand DNA-binding protein